MIEVSYKSQNSGIQASLRLLFEYLWTKWGIWADSVEERLKRCCCRVQTGSLDIDVVHCSLFASREFIKCASVWTTTIFVTLPLEVIFVCCWTSMGCDPLSGVIWRKINCGRLGSTSALLSSWYRDEAHWRTPLFPTVNGFSMCYKCFFLLWTNLIAPHIILDLIELSLCHSLIFH